MNERLLLGSGHGVGAAGWREKTQGSRVGTGEVQGGVAPRQGGWRGSPVVVSEPLQLRSQLAGCVHLPLAHLPEQPRRQRVLLAARHHLRHRLPIVSQALVLAAFVIVRVVNVNGLLLGVAADDATHVVAMRLREPDAHPAMNEAGGGGRGGLWGVLRASRCAWATSGWRLHGAPPPRYKEQATEPRPILYSRPHRQTAPHHPLHPRRRHSHLLRSACTRSYSSRSLWLTDSTETFILEFPRKHTLISRPVLRDATKDSTRSMPTWSSTQHSPAVAAGGGRAAAGRAAAEGAAAEGAAAGREAAPKRAPGKYPAGAAAMAAGFLPLARAAGAAGAEGTA